MSRESYFERFLEWQNYAHYLLLALLFTMIMSLGQISISLILFVALILFITDSVVHAIFWYIPKPFQWRS